MGVTRTFKYSAKDFREEMLRLQKTLITMNAQENEPWNILINVLHHRNTENTVVLYHLTYQNYQIAVLSTKDSKELVQGDSNLSKVIESMQCYKLRQSYIVSGIVYQLGDFIFRIGIGSISNENRCLICEVEFIGTRYISEATPCILEFMSLIDPRSQLILTEIKYDHYFQLNSEESNNKITAIDLLFCLNCIAL